MRGYRYEALDGVRGIAAQAVLVSHALGMAYPHLEAPVAGVVEWVGRLSVMVFFSLSGFVIATSLSRLIAQDRDRFVLPYAVHRIARIWPPLILAIVVTFAVGAIGHAGLPLLTRTGDPYRLDLIAFLRGITLTFGPGDATFVIDRALWSLRQEVYLYGVAAFAALALVRTGLVRLVAGTVVVGMIAITADRFFYPQSLALFAAGAGAALFGHRLGAWADSGLLWPATALLLVLPLATVSDPGYVDALSDHRGLLAYQAALGLPLALCLLNLATRDGRATRLFTAWRGAAAFSYTLYVIHVPVMTLVFSLRAHQGWVPGAFGTVLTLLVALAVAQGLSYVAARFVERPRQVRALIFRALGVVGHAPRPAQAEASPTRAAKPSR
ncbi:acyltransferase [Methylobacterium sp. Leaf466]|uniref:acyltransferase family protein n=1 Tax=Methylobacterium sp. Leaf466 TaxID=1736386 RepID=UPI0006F5BA60|nr:acyltransferase [Methylobacterium sp. Leaf466]KQT78907.1 hypothetical protein ASG59_06980 [Methylobacterium sp. Leaf466]